jgi:hypothetical protein
VILLFLVLVLVAFAYDRGVRIDLHIIVRIISSVP